VEGKYAIATWQWGEAGGQSILLQQGKRWKVVGSGGGAVDLATLKQKGVPDKIADQLMQKEQAAQKH
jgi:glucokinase